MKNFYFNSYPNGKKRAITFSFDDGKVYDRKLTELFNKYDIKCTFNLNAVNIGKENYTDKAFILEQSQRHEIASHGFTHPFLERIPTSLLNHEIGDDKKALEDITGKEVIGFAYPYGTRNADVIKALKDNGIKYARTVDSTSAFNHSPDFLEWHPTCHINNAMPLVEKFFSRNYSVLDVFYIWGHSYELANSFDKAEDLFKALKEHNDVWFCTNGEFYNYVTAIKNLKVFEDKVVNDSEVSVFCEVDGKPTEFKKGTTQL